jgi:uncharacterized membrane protein YczE
MLTTIRRFVAAVVVVVAVAVASAARTGTVVANVAATATAAIVQPSCVTLMSSSCGPMEQPGGQVVSS